MSRRSQWIRLVLAAAGILFAVVGSQNDVTAQAGQPGQQPTSGTFRETAPLDLTGYWVAIVTEDWRFRMVTPPKGDYSSVPINAEGRRVADAWDLARDNASGDQCKAFGVGAVMRNPGRVHITWENDNTLRIDVDAGQQTRLLRFGDPQPSAERTWQGDSVAAWEARPPRGGGANPAPGGTRPGGSLRVLTKNVRTGYLRANGVPYSENAVITEFFDRHTDYGQEWFTVTTIVNDPKYLTDEFITSTHFRKEPDGSKWSPTPCQTPAPGK